ncbi:hypothetical protein Q664_07555 [Archangium violaceum Cb vi76]|uniref:Dihydroorotate dehydrogenase catalytic domain-containing protein n=1 Tax=Archangium violaceum Cb vi76 TaxID=1406225 RepID=A0A084SYT1_9BACT|nr:hypothetical protein Q664_07555 [Archangium violaceum Cb vi76]
MSADTMVVNASSPNTPGLRKLQEPEQLTALLRAVKARLEQVAPGKPLFLKIAPDLTPEDGGRLSSRGEGQSRADLLQATGGTGEDCPVDLSDPQRMRMASAIR